MPEIIFNGPAGRLEGRYHHAKAANAPMAIVLHPHPLHGGTMNNRVTYAMYQSFVRAGFSVLRFNFRGVGKSHGVFDRGEGELSDAAAALDWMQTINPNAGKVWVAGFSFGAWIAMQLLMRRPETFRFIVAAPPANMYDFTFLAPCPSSGLILTAEKDEIVTHDSVTRLAEKLRAQRGLKLDQVMIPGANHLFVDRVDALTTLVDGYIAREMGYPLPHSIEMAPQAA